MTPEQEQKARESDIRADIRIAKRTGKGKRSAGMVGALTVERIFYREKASAAHDEPTAHDFWQTRFNKPLVMSDCLISEDNGDEFLYLMKNGHVYVMDCEGEEVWTVKIENGKINIKLPAALRKDQSK